MAYTRVLRRCLAVALKLQGSARRRATRLGLPSLVLALAGCSSFAAPQTGTITVNVLVEGTAIPESFLVVVMEQGGGNSVSASVAPQGSAVFRNLGLGFDFEVTLQRPPECSDDAQLVASGSAA